MVDMASAQELRVDGRVQVVLLSTGNVLEHAVTRNVLVWIHVDPLMLDNRQTQVMLLVGLMMLFWGKPWLIERDSKRSSDEGRKG